jgi:hypothetical protein
VTRKFKRQISDLTPSDLRRTRDAVNQSINAISIHAKRKRKYSDFQTDNVPTTWYYSENLQNPYEGVITARQLDESVDEFISRVDPITYSQSTVPDENFQPYAWIANFKTAGNGRIDSEEEHNQHAEFVKKGKELLEAFKAAQETIRQAGQGKAESTIKRRIFPVREKLKSDILSLAKACKITSGKWLLFPNELVVRPTWTKIARSVSSGRLGPVAKISLKVGDKARPLYVYTGDFSDVEDVKRVLWQLKKLGHTSDDERWIYYKCDAYTHLGIMSGNEYGLDASLYASGRMLEGKYDESGRQSVGPSLKKGGWAM